MNLTTEQVKQLIEVYPFLLPRNVWTGEVVDDFKYDYVDGLWCVPEGWSRLFLLFCKDIKPLLGDKLNTFRFSEVKEKYGRLCLYNFGATEAAHTLIRMYETYSMNVCEYCGKIATYRSRGWITSVCEDCHSKYPYETTRWKQCKFSSYCTYSKEGKFEYSVSNSLKNIDKQYSMQ